MVGHSKETLGWETGVGHPKETLKLLSSSLQLGTPGTLLWYLGYLGYFNLGIGVFGAFRVFRVLRVFRVFRISGVFRVSRLFPTLGGTLLLARSTPRSSPECSTSVRSCKV